MVLVRQDPKHCKSLLLWLVKVSDLLSIGQEKDDQEDKYHAASVTDLRAAFKYARVAFERVLGLPITFRAGRTHDTSVAFLTVLERKFCIALQTRFAAKAGYRDLGVLVESNVPLSWIQFCIAWAQRVEWTSWALLLRFYLRNECVCIFWAQLARPLIRILLAPLASSCLE